MEPYEDRRKKSPEEIEMIDEEIREIQEKREKLERELILDMAQKRLKKKLKYRFALSNDGMLLLLVVGGWISFALFRKSLIELAFSGSNSYRTMAIVAGIVIFMAIWLLYSLIQRRKLKREAQELADSGELKFEDLLPADVNDGLFKPEKKKASDVKIEFPIEDFETLPELDFDLAEEEWDRMDRIVTDKFYRMPAFIQHIENGVYTVFIELRYEDAYPNYRLLQKTLKEMESALTELQAPLSSFKEKAMEITREYMAMSFPNVHLREVCIAIKQIA